MPFDRATGQWISYGQGLKQTPGRTGIASGGLGGQPAPAKPASAPATAGPAMLAGARIQPRPGPGVRPGIAAPMAGAASQSTPTTGSGASTAPALWSQGRSLQGPTSSQPAGTIQIGAPAFGNQYGTSIGSQPTGGTMQTGAPAFGTPAGKPSPNPYAQPPYPAPPNQEWVFNWPTDLDGNPNAKFDEKLEKGWILRPVGPVTIPTPPEAPPQGVGSHQSLPAGASPVSISRASMDPSRAFGVAESPQVGSLSTGATYQPIRPETGFGLALSGNPIGSKRKRSDPYAELFAAARYGRTPEDVIREAAQRGVSPLIPRR